MQVLKRFYGLDIYRCTARLKRACEGIDKIAGERYKVLEFYKEYGIKATLTAFRISRSTLYNWQKSYREYGIRGLREGSRRPIRTRSSEVEEGVIKEIEKIREEHYRLNQNAIRNLLEDYCKERGYKLPSSATIGRIIRKLKEEGKIRSNKRISLNGRTGTVYERGYKYKKKLRRGGFIPSKPGELLQVDSVHVYVDGIKRYMLTAIDIKTRIAFSYCYKGLNSNNAKDFIEKAKEAYPYPIERIQTDNGLEFHKNFDKSLEEKKVIHYFNYPRSPKSNAYIERFNRTLREQFINENRDSFYDEKEINEKLMKYLIWYNTKRAHQGLKWQTPMEYTLKNFDGSNFLIKKSNM